MKILSLTILLPLLLVWLSCCHCTRAITRYYNFEIDYANYTVGCASKEIVAVNGQSPGPTIHLTRGDRVVINVTNLVPTNITIHWHGINQRLTSWADGAAYISQCPIQTGRSYVYNFSVPDQQGTLFWHAHISWLRGTVYGAIVIDPPANKSLPFPTPDGDHVLTLGEWWNADIQEVERQALINGNGFALSDAYLINGYPGPLYNCSGIDDTEIVTVKKGTTHLLRVINNALETDLFITIANHSLTVIETDASYTKQITNTSFLISPGQTYTFFVTADQAIGQYYIVVSPFERLGPNSVQEIPAAAILRYEGADTSTTPVYPGNVPLRNDTVFFNRSQTEIRSLDSEEYPAEVPQAVDVDLYYVISLNVEPCTAVPNVSNCLGPNNGSFAASVNNMTFQLPGTAILQAYYYSISGVYTSDFPSRPLNPYNYTGQQLLNQASVRATTVAEIPFGSNVQLVLQGTITGVPEAHPFHLHGNDFYVVGYGEGNYDFNTDPADFNLVDPSRRNTAMVTRAGWTALRFKADNPGVWLLHCHFDGHMSWGMEMAFIVTNGNQPNQTLPPPPPDLPTC